MRNQQPGLPQPWLRQQPGVSDLQSRQQNFMLRQLQELQRQQQLQQLDQEARQRMLNPLSAISKQTTNEQLSSLAGGASIQDASSYMWPNLSIGVESKIPGASQMVMGGNSNWVNRNTSLGMHGFSNGFVFPQEQSQAFRSMGLVPQHFDQSLYGAPVATPKGAFNQYSHLQGISNDGVDMLTKASGNQVDKSLTHPTSFSPFHNDQSAVFTNQVGVSDSVSVSRHGFQGKNLFGHVPMESFNNGITADNSQQMNPLSGDVQLQEFHDRQDQVCWEGNLQEKVASQVGPSQGSVSLDPTEAKILFDTDEGMWNNSFGRVGGIGSGGFVSGNQFEGNDYLNVFPSLQSGSWSALMQSAVAEASSTDTGLQDEWSGLNLQKSGLSSENHATAMNDSGKQPATRVDNNLQAASSLPSRPFLLFDDSNMSPSGHVVPGFQQNASHESLQQQSHKSNKLLDQSPQQKPLLGASFQAQTPIHLDNTQEGAWGSQIYDPSRGSAQSAEMDINTQNMQGSWNRQQSTSSYNVNNQQYSKRNGWFVNESLAPNEDPTLKILDNENAIRHAQSSDSRGSLQVESDLDSQTRRTDDNVAAISFPNLTGGFEQVKSGIGSPQMQQLQQSQHLDYGKHALLGSSAYRGADDVRKYRHQLSHCPDAREPSMNTSDGVSGEAYDKKFENYCQKEISDSSTSGPSHPHQHSVGDAMKENTGSFSMDSRLLAGGNQKSVGQVGRKPSVSRKFQYHPMGNLGIGAESSDTIKNFANSQGISQLVTRGLKVQDQRYFGQSKTDHVASNNFVDPEKGCVPDLQRTARADEVSSRNVHPGFESTSSTPFDRSTTFYTQNQRATQTSQNMLELLHKVDQSRENNTATDVSSGHNPPEMCEATVPEGSPAHLQRGQNSGSHGFGLRLGPPSQRPLTSNYAMSSQTSSQAADGINLGHDQEVLHGKSLGTATPRLPFSRSQLQQQHIFSASAKVTDPSLSVSFANQSDVDARSKLASHSYSMSDSHDAAEQSAQATFPGGSSRTLPFNLALHGEACGPGAQSYPSSAVHSQPVNVSSSLRVSGHPTPVLQLPVTSGTSHGGFSSMLQNVWTNVASQQRFSSVLPGNIPPNILQSMHPSTSSADAASRTPRKVDAQVLTKGSGPSEFGSSSYNSEHSSYRDEQQSRGSSLQQLPHERLKLAAETTGSLPRNGPMVHPRQMDIVRGLPVQERSFISQTENASLRGPVNSNDEMESFGCSLKSSADLQRNYSLLHQMQAMRGADMGPSRSGKRLKGPDFTADAQEGVANMQQFTYDSNTMARDPVEDKLGAASQHMQFPPSDPNMLSFLSEAKEDRNVNASSHLHIGDTPVKDTAMFGRSDPHNNSNLLGGPSIASFRGNEQPRINPKMAPSWFERYGTYKNGQILPAQGGVDISQKDAKMVAQQFFLGKVSEGLHTQTAVEQANAGNASQAGNIWQTSLDNALPASEGLPSSHSSFPVVDQSLAVARVNKRKIASAGLLPWHKEVTQGSQRLQSISSAEVDWAHAAKRLIEKVEDEAEIIDDGPLMPRPRRRLVLTTQLMQQLLRALPASLLSADATAEFESVAYYTAKFASGDACGHISCSGSESHGQANNRSLISRNFKASESEGDQFFLKVVEEFINRARKLENDLLRLDRRASILDIRVECQDMEKVSVINRFARFHGRGNADGVDSSSSSEVTSQLPDPQRYVTPVPMPKNLPEGVPCFSL